MGLSSSIPLFDFVVYDFKGLIIIITMIIMIIITKIIKQSLINHIFTNV